MTSPTSTTVSPLPVITLVSVGTRQLMIMTAWRHTTRVFELNGASAPALIQVGISGLGIPDSVAQAHYMTVAAQHD